MQRCDAPSPSLRAKFLIISNDTLTRAAPTSSPLGPWHQCRRRTFDLADVLQFFAIDVVGELTLGKSFGLCKAVGPTQFLTDVG
ncbi:hypothetical protein B0H10DRAFT_579285 [Mycena sp. CBHHK59/15]|nr:hypothetical protein B0H10DRAFT_579285 [Mycena sp. CBHHK59/15]